MNGILSVPSQLVGTLKPIQLLEIFSVSRRTVEGRRSLLPGILDLPLLVAVNEFV